jgi:hypothetical protein
LVAHEENPSSEITKPEARRCRRNCSDTLREWVSPVTVKFAALVAVPPAVVTEILPVVAPDGTVAVILVDEFTAKDDETLLNLTAVVVKPDPEKFVPLIVTDEPAGPEIGENELMVGLGGVVTLKLLELVAVPPGVVTRILPSVAPDGTVAVILVEEFTVNEAETLLNVTLLTLTKFDPLIVTEVPTGPELGEKELIVGAGGEVTSKLVELVAVPPGVVTRILPSVAPDGTVAVILVEEFTVNEAETLLNVTAEVVKPLPLKLVPLMVTKVLTGPDGGENEPIVGAGTEVVTVKLDRLEPVPPDAVTLIGPDVAPKGTEAVILVDESTE